MSGQRRSHYVAWAMGFVGVIVITVAISIVSYRGAQHPGDRIPTVLGVAGVAVVVLGIMYGLMHLDW